MALGTVIDIDAAKVVPDENLSISEGAVKPWDNYFERDGSKKDLSWGLARIEAMEEGWGLNLDIPWKRSLKKLETESSMVQMTPATNSICNGREKMERPMEYGLRRLDPTPYAALYET